MVPPVLTRMPIRLRIPHGDEATDLVQDHDGAALVTQLAKAAQDLVERSACRGPTVTVMATEDGRQFEEPLRIPLLRDLRPVVLSIHISLLFTPRRYERH